MAIECINPPNLKVPKAYTQVVIAAGARMIFIAGQVPEDAGGKLVGDGEFSAQAHQAFANLGRALAAAGAHPSQVARISIYVVGYQRDYHVPIFEEARAKLFGEHKPADVVLGVTSLSPGHLIEVDAVAVVDV